MRKYILLAALVFGFAVANAQTYSLQKLEKVGNAVNVALTGDLSDLSVGSRRAVTLVPKLVNGNNSKELGEISILGRNNYIYALRNGLLGQNAYKKSEAPKTYNLNTSVPYEPWMKNANLVVEKKCYACCGKLTSTDLTTVGQLKVNDFVFTPDFLYVKPNAEIKTGTQKGCAHIEYKVNQSNLLPNFRNNKAELDNILALIETVKNDPDNKVKNITIKGSASPEGSFAHNEKLAKARTETLAKYISKQLGDAEIETSFVAEDFDGYIAWVEQSNLTNKAGILDILNGSLDQDAKEKAVKAQYPEDYAVILSECYPALRKADYCVEYVIDDFTDVNKISEYVKTNPEKLSLNEFFVAANQYQPGSSEFNEIIKAALKLYPDSEVANLNAGNAAMSVGDLVAARNYLNKAGNSNEAAYAKGILETLCGNYAAAKDYFNKAKSTVSKANAALKAFENL